MRRYLMKKILLYVCLFFCSLMLTSCIDVVQHITRKSDGTEKNIISITFSKAIFEMAKAMQGDSFSPNYDDFFKELGETDSLNSDGFSATRSKIDNEFSAGYLIDMDINYKDKAIKEKVLSNIEAEGLPVHVYDKDKIVINLGFLHNNATSKNDEMGQAFLASAKYRLLLSKTCMPKLSKVVLKSRNGEMNMAYADFYDEYLIEIPILLLVEKQCTMELYQ